MLDNEYKAYAHALIEERGELLRELGKYVESIDLIYNHNEACKYAVEKYFGKIHSPIAQEGYLLVRMKKSRNVGDRGIFHGENAREKNPPRKLE